MTKIYIFMMGLLIGSFLNVIIYRLPRKESIVFPASHCPECKEKLRVRDLIPVLSFILNRGKCKYCGRSISLQYPVVELLTGFLLLSLYIHFGINTEFIIYSLLVFVLIAISFIDIKYMIIPNKITYPAFILALIAAVFFDHIDLKSSLIGALVPFTFFFLIALVYGKGLGMGDGKLVAVIGAVLGWDYTMLGIFLASLIGTIVILALLLARVIDRKTRIPFGPFISIGTIITIFYGREIIEFIFKA